GDARLALPSRADDAYDGVLGDAFGSLSVPWHLTTVEFVSELRRVLAPGGLYVVNLIDYPPADFARAETATLLEVFDDVAVVAPADYLAGERGGNFIVVAAVDGTIDRAALAAAIETRGDDEVVTDPAATLEFAGDARPLVDDFAPVDQLLSRP
ncbi:MAG: fused MFS/spermidine synthase, partial [Acidimicrobiia bacterium]